jgi:DNA mismatch repair protein MutL
MSIKKLPQYLINKIKAWEIVERPYSVVKELIENSLDAGATEIIVSINAWGKTNIKIEDNGSWISINDLKMSIERYATSKLFEENDLQNINSYWFRGEALAAISEISKFKIQTKTLDKDIW